MSESEADVVVVGAGPGGSIAALRLARHGLRVLLVDARRFPRRKVCAGGISPRGRTVLRELALWDAVRASGYFIGGIRLVAPSGRETLVEGAESAIVVPRERLDALLVEEAVRAGATFHDGLPIRGPLERGGRTCGVRAADGREIRARWVIAADGAVSRFTLDPRPRQVLHSCMAWFEGLAFRPHVLEMIFDPELAPHYGWLFPEGPNRVNLGLLIAPDRHAGRPIRDVFRRFLDKYYAQRIAAARALGDWRGHPLLVTVGIRHQAPPGTLLVGEACRLVNPATGEGVAYAMESGVLAADAIAEGLRRGVAADDVAASYARALRSAFAVSFLGAELFRRWGASLLDPLARLGQNALFRRLARQPATTG